jgi:hypothetical protein
METKKINDVQVIPIKGVQHGFGRFRSEELFKSPYCNIGIFSSKNRGKTTLINTIIWKSIDKNTKVHIFCSTIEKDPSWIAISEKLAQKGIDVFTYSSIFPESKDDVGLADIFASKKEEEDDKDSKDEKRKVIAPELLIIFDDMPVEELRHKLVYNILKKNRHYKAQIIISSQYGLDINANSRKQVDYWLLLGGLQESMLKNIYNSGGFSMSFEIFMKMYKQATREQYGFLMASSIFEDYRINFSEQFTLPK